MRKFIFGCVLAGLCILNTAVYSQMTQAFTVVNNTGMVISGVSISPNDANSWGLSLNTKTSIAKDESFEFKQAVDKSNCVYDLRFTGEDGKYYYMQDVDLCKTTSIALVKADSDMKKDDGSTKDQGKKNDEPGIKTDDQTKKSDKEKLEKK